MLSRTAWTEVINERLEPRIWRSAVGPDISTMRFPLTRGEHLHRRFVSVDHALSKHCFA